MRMFSRSACALSAMVATALTMSLPGPLLAAALVGSGPHLPLPAVIPPLPDYLGPTISPSATPIVNFTGTWSSPVQPDWVGTFSATGPYPAGLPNPTGTTNYDFTSLPTGMLPSGSYFVLGDLDGGSASGESFTLTAFDLLDQIVLTPWLEEPLGAYGTGAGNTLAMPGWEWDGGAGTYFFTGETEAYPGNPSIAVVMQSLLPMAKLQVERSSGFANFAINAPVGKGEAPLPGTALLLGAGLAALGMRRRRRCTSPGAA